MSSWILGLVGIVLLLVLVYGGMRIAYACLLLAFVGIGVIKGWPTAMETIGSMAYSQANSYTFFVIPMFVLMGFFAAYAGIADEIFDSAEKWLGHLRGGLVLACIFGCAAFGACTGSAASAAVVAGKILIPKMRMVGYAPSLAAGAVASCGQLAILIPPSTMMVIYGIITEQSIGRLLIAGILPGIFTAVIYAVGIYVWALFDPKVGPVVPSASWKERFVSLRNIWAVYFVVALMLGGLYFGVFTPSEAGAAGAMGIFIIALLRRKMNSWKALSNVLRETLSVCGMLFILLIAIFIYTNFASLSGFTRVFLDGVLGLGVSPLVTLVLILFIYLFLGCVIGSIGMMVLTLPVVFPAIVQLGYDPIWFGIIVIMMCEIGGITPPIAVQVFVVHAVVPDISIQEITRGTLPFLAMQIIIVIICIAFPQIITFLPSVMMRG